MKQEMHTLSAEIDLASVLNDASIDQLLAIDIDRKIISWNLACESYTGFSRIEVLGKTLEQIFPKVADNVAINNSIQLATEGHTCYVPSDQAQYRTGYFEHHFVPLKDSAKNITGVLIIIHNVAHRVKAENELKELNKSLELFKKISDTTTDAVIILDINGNIFYWNAAAEKIYEYTAGQAVGSPVENIIVAGRSSQSLKQLHQQLISGEILPDDIVTAHLSKNLLERHVTVNLFLIKDENNEVIATCAAVKDITERVKYSESIKLLNHELSAKNGQLRTLNTELKAFTYVASNDYTDTLKMLYTNMEFIISNGADKLSNSVKATIRKSQSAIQKMKLLTNDIVAFARLHESDFQLKTVALDQVLDTVLESFRLKIENLSVSIRRSELPKVKGYPILIGLMFHHLIDNAIKFRGGTEALTIDISGLNEDRLPDAASVDVHNQKFSSITFKDNAIGIDEEFHEKVFELFTNVHGEKYKGSGIGLALCRKIMELHGGYIFLKGKKGSGSAFTLYFPVDGPIINELEINENDIIAGR